MAKQHHSRRPPAGYTLLEILVICSILGILWAQLMPMLGSFRENARRQSCGNNLKQLGIAFHNYHETYKRMPPNGLFFWTRQSRNGYTWYNTSRGSQLVKLLPFMEEDPIYSKLNQEKAGTKQPNRFEEEIFGPENKWIRSEVIDSYLCPSADLDPYLDGTNPLQDRAISCYAVSIGAQSMPSRQRWCTDYPGNIFGTGPVQHGDDARGYRLSGVFARGHWAAKIRDITDGTAQVIMAGETLPNKSYYQRHGWMSVNGVWTATTAPINYPVIGVGERGYPGSPGCKHHKNWQTSNGFRSRHPGGAQFVFADGSVHLLSEDIGYLTYQRLGDRRDGQPIGDNWRP